ncbi:flavin-containing monooxygenase [Rhodococcus oxybenzonivorans]|uniref:flavin-containing monooxygenase n=1 Tax=Rhodococcus oxybenzonivorans TaxID=1990687 RepID=UPI0029546974|nr:NAD(P)/FAD-dependent oxidoreductase [Rhodococcus oxybenzonivorans]MDV7272836.1 NAD(P)/FAD-dependent oxidoreductase [Rhodococcus oxybenzonivorans]
MTVTEEVAGRSNTAEVDATAAMTIFTTWLDTFTKALLNRDAGELSDVLAPNAWWRDMVALDWQMSSHHGTADITSFVFSSPQAIAKITLDDIVAPSHTTPEPGTSWIEGFFHLETGTVRGRGHARLIEDSDGSWRAWTVLTEGAELNNRPLAVRHRRPRPSGHATETPWHHRRADSTSFERTDPEVLIIGGAQNGLGLAATLGLMGVDTLVVEKSERVGDVWRDRYESLVLHAPVYSDHLPHFPFPDSWPVYTPARKFANWLETYAEAMELNVWNGTEVASADYDRDASAWTVVTRSDAGERTLRPRHFVVATGTSSVPWVPGIPGREEFSGTVIHSSEHRTGQGWQDRNVVVVGAGTSAHDVAEDFHYGGAHVTMVQRGPTYVLSRDRGNKILFESAYSEDSLPLDYADLQSNSIPWPLLLQMAESQTAAIADEDRDMLDGLEAAGFSTCMGDRRTGERSGLMSFGCRPGGPGGYYVDVGASQLIIDGKIAVRSGVGLDRFTRNGVVLSDGTELAADLVVLATGFLDMRESSRKFLGDAVVDSTGAFYGIDETRNERGLIFQPSGFPHLWYAGGGVIEVRRYGKFLALQIAAELDGLVE